MCLQGNSYYTKTAAKYIRKANYLILEANYDDEMLKMGSYPQYLKERISMNRIFIFLKSISNMISITHPSYGK